MADTAQKEKIAEHAIASLLSQRGLLIAKPFFDQRGADLLCRGAKFCCHVSATLLPPAATVRVLGVDDWAFRKGGRYGTLLVDLERHQLVDLLPDRESQTLAAWLAYHPQIEVISRDRAGGYAQGARQGAPQAQQVADRWHLLKNLAQTLERFLETHRPALRQAAPLLEDATPVVWPPTKGRADEEDRKQRRQRRLERYQQVLALHEQGVGQREIARTLHLARGTVERYLRTGEFPEVAERKPEPTSLDPFKPYLHRRWQEGCHNACQFARELKEQGYQGTRSWVCRYVTAMRQAAAGAPTPKTPAARSVAYLFLSREADRDDKQKAFLAHLCHSSPTIQTAYTLAQQFVQMVRKRQQENLPAWMEAVRHSAIAALSGFCDSLTRDLSAVEAGLSLNWSNGQTEGQVNRLKMIKRQMYGRAKFDLLRARVMPIQQAA